MIDVFSENGIAFVKNRLFETDSHDSYCCVQASLQARRTCDINYITKTQKIVWNNSSFAASDWSLTGPALLHVSTVLVCGQMQCTAKPYEALEHSNFLSSLISFGFVRKGKSLRGRKFKYLLLATCSLGSYCRVQSD